MNFIFVSPNFPFSYWNFCERLHVNGANVLGIGDAPYDDLSYQCQSALTEYYRVDTLEDYDQVYRAVAYFAFKYGRIDWLESNNEYWLCQDAHLRTDFNIRSGVDVAGIHELQSKVAMKKHYAAAGIPTARQARVTTLSDARAFAAKVGYPLIAKPEVGVGAQGTYKADNDEELTKLFDTRLSEPYVIEEFVWGNIYSYDAIINSKGEVLFDSSCWFPPSIMDVKDQQLDLFYYVVPDVPAQLRERGRATIAGFNVVSRFVHLEFFCLDHDQPGLGNAGDFIGLELNARPAGGYTPDMMDFAHSCDVYKIWADMVCFDHRTQAASNENCWCAYAARRDIHHYVHSHEEILERYGERLAMCVRMPDSLSDDMGNQTYTAKLHSLAELDEFQHFVQDQL